MTLKTTKERDRANSKKISLELNNYSEINDIIKNNGLNMSYYINLGTTLLLHLYDAKINYIESEELRKLKISAAKQNAETYDNMLKIHDIMGELILDSLSIYLRMIDEKIEDENILDRLKNIAKKEKCSVNEKITHILKDYIEKNYPCD